MKKNKIIIFCIIIYMIIPYNSGKKLHAGRVKSSQKAGEQVKAEKGLKDNQYFIYYIDTTVTNLGNEEDKRKYKAIVQKYLLSRFLYMKFLFSESFKEIRKTQEMLIELYISFLDREVRDTKALLNKFAPYVVQSKDAHARLHLRIGYRSTTHSNIDRVMADNYRPSLYSMRIYKYIRAMKKVKEAKRYALLSIIWLNLPAKEKILEKKYTYKAIEKKILKLNFPEDMDYFLLIHMDSYYKSKDKMSQFEVIWDNPELEKDSDFNKYLKMSY